MDATISILFQSDFFKIKDFKCNCKEHGISGTEYSKRFNISFVRKGNFNYKVFKENFDAFTGHAIVDKPGCEYSVGHFHHVPDECTIIEFNDYFYQNIFEEQNLAINSFFKSKDIQSALLKIPPQIEYLHHAVINQCIENKAALYIDNLVFEILLWVLNTIQNGSKNTCLNSKLKKNHLQTIEKAKHYISNNYMNDISFKDISEFVNVSPFHFSRLFKQFTNISPYKFLLDVRLKHSEFLIRNTSLPIYDIAFQSGFNNIEHFSAAFKQVYSLSPVNYRKKL